MIAGLDGDLAAEGKGSSGLEDERCIPHFDGLGVRFAHVDVEGDLLELEVGLLLGEQLPHVLLFGFTEMRLLCLKLHRPIADFNHHHTIEHQLQLQISLFPFLHILFGHQLNHFFMQLLFLCLFGNIGPAQGTAWVDEHCLQETLGAECVVAVGLEWAVVDVETDGAFVVLLLFG